MSDNNEVKSLQKKIVLKKIYASCLNEYVLAIILERNKDLETNMCNKFGSDKVRQQNK